MRSGRLPLVLVATLFATAAAAHHPGADLDRVMAEKEPAFEPVDWPRAPAFALVTVSGETLPLADLESRIVVLSFVPAACLDSCAAQQAALAAVQAGVNVTPMREMVTFLTILPGPEAALPADITEAFDPVNWRSLTPEAGWNSVPALAEAYAGTTGRPGSGPMSYVVDRGGRLAAIFHGTDFGYVNMILYVNGLTNVHPARDRGFWARVRDVLP
jgi:hypothetical protein